MKVIFKISATIVLLAVLTSTEVSAEYIPSPSQKIFKNTNFIHDSTISSGVVFVGQSIILSNHVTRMGYNIAGRKQIILIPLQAKPSFGEKGIKTNSNNDVVMLTDKLGSAVTNFRINRPGTFEIDVLFMNRKSGYYEHIVKHKVNVHDKINWSVHALMVLLLLFSPSVLLTIFKSRAQIHYLTPFNWINAVYWFIKKNRNESFDKRQAKFSLVYSLALGFATLLGYVFNQEAAIIVLFWLVAMGSLTRSHRQNPLMITVGIMFIIATLFLLTTHHFLLAYGDYLQKTPVLYKNIALFISSFIFPPYMWTACAGFLYKIGGTRWCLIIGLFISAMPCLGLYFKAMRTNKGKIENKKE